MGKIVISSSYKTRKHIAATHCTGFNIGDKQAVEKRFRGRLCKAKMAEKAQFTGVNEHFEAIFNAAEATQIVFQQPARTPFLFTPPPTKAKKNATPEDYWGRAGRMLSKPHKRDLVRQPPGMGSRRLLSILPARPASLLTKPRYEAPNWFRQSACRYRP